MKVVNSDDEEKETPKLTFNDKGKEASKQESSKDLNTFDKLKSMMASIAPSIFYQSVDI